MRRAPPEVEMSKPVSDTGALRKALARLAPHDHLCLIYETREEQFAAIVPFVRLGLERGERCIYIADDNTAQTVLDALRAGEIDVDAALASGALIIAAKQDAYLRPVGAESLRPYFDPDRMIQFLAQAVAEAKAAGFAALRATGEMTWALGGAPGAERLIEYEAKLNHFFPEHDLLAICQYNRYRFSPAVILDVIRTHPLVISGGMVCRNPCYLMPEELLGADGAAREVERILESLREREQVEADLRKSEERYRTLAETAQDMIFVIDRADRVQYVNTAAARAFGRQPLDLTGQPRADLFPPPVADQQKHFLQQVFETGQPIVRDDRLAFAGGEYWINTQLAPLRNPEGQVEAVMGIARDVTERVRAEESIRQGLARAERSERTLLALSQAAAAVQQALTPEEVYRAIGDEVVKLGYHAIAYHLNDAGDEMSIAYITYAANLIRQAGKLVGISIQDFRIRLAPGDIIQQVIAERRAVFYEGRAIEMFIAAILPGLLRPLAGRLVAMFGLRKGIVAPLATNGSVIGILAITGDDLREADIPAVSAFANQAAVALEKARLYERAQGEIAERKRAEEKLRESEARFRSITEASPDGLAVSRATDGLILYANAHLGQMLGVPASEMIGKRSSDFYAHPEDRQALLDAIAREGWKDNFEALLRRADGTLFWGLASVRLGRFEGEAAFYVGVRDITERKRTEEELRKLSRTVEQSPVSIVITDTTGKIEYVNPKFKQVTGYAAEEAIGQNPRLLKSGETPPEEYEHMWKTITGGGEWRGEFHNKKKSGELYWEQASISPIFDAGGVITHFLAVKEDITGRKQHERELESIAAVSAALRAARARADMLPIILGQALDLLQAGGAALAMRDPASGETVVELARGQWQTWTGRRLAPGAGISGQVIASGQPYLSDDAASDPRAVHPDLFRNLHAAACVPLIVHDHTIGALWVGRERGFAADEVRLLTSIADIAANAIHRAALHELTERRAEQLLSLHEIDVAISSSLDLRLTLRVLVSQITSRLRVDAAAVLMLEPHSQRLQFAAASGFRAPGIEHSSLRLGEGYAGRAALERRGIFVPDLREVGSQFVRAALVADEGFVAYYGVPLIVKGQVTGVLEIYQRSPLAPDEAWLEFMETLATQATIAIDNATLFNNLQRSNLELQLAYDTTIEGWSRALDLREHETELHSARVAEMTERLARALGVSEAGLVHIRRGALLHDIGKMGVPDSILLKPGKLTEEEWAVMRRHPQQAYDLLAPITFLRPALDIPYCHHERWDGAGYPRQLKGEAIPLAARLFAVADVFDALTSDRPYRPALSKEEAIQYIREQSGRHFDPQVVEAFLDVV
jgi:PAS domain S-box-containing protein